ncbi:MAG: hypothetical protein IT377_04705 [Polyangiaceae bacterium]|nr:hypothetical protein [Polyangiaceae bacterium]
MKNRVFFPQRALDSWVGADRVDLMGGELVIKGEGRKYRVVEAVRILAEVTGGVDVHELVGKVKSVSFLTELGAEVLDTSMVLGELAYDVVPGFSGTPIGSFEEHRATSVPPVEGPASSSDEEMLATYLASHLE